MDQITNALEPCKQFAKDSMRLVKRCTKPDRKGKLIRLVIFICGFLLLLQKACVMCSSYFQVVGYSVSFNVEILLGNFHDVLINLYCLPTNFETSLCFMVEMHSLEFFASYNEKSFSQIYFFPIQTLMIS